MVESEFRQQWAACVPILLVVSGSQTLGALASHLQKKERTCNVDHSYYRSQAPRNLRYTWYPCLFGFGHVYTFIWILGPLGNYAFAESRKPPSEASIGGSGAKRVMESKSPGGPSTHVVEVLGPNLYHHIWVPTLV